MADEFVNKLTLNCLISKTQLHKLNKKLRDTSDKKKLIEIQEYGSRVEELFKLMLNSNPPDNLLLDVKYTFDAFVEKSIYYLKAQDNSIMYENRRSDIIHNDIDFDKEDKDTERGNFQEKDSEDREDGEDGEEEDGEEEDDGEEDDSRKGY